MFTREATENPRSIESSLIRNTCAGVLGRVDGFSQDGERGRGVVKLVTWF